MTGKPTILLCSVAALLLLSAGAGAVVAGSAAQDVGTDKRDTAAVAPTATEEPLRGTNAVETNTATTQDYEDVGSGTLEAVHQSEVGYFDVSGPQLQQAAVEPDTPLTVSDADEEDPFDDLANRYWHGQTVLVTGVQANETVEVYRIDGGNRTFVRALSADEDGEVLLRTGRLDANNDYQLERPGPDGSPISDVFAVTAQTLDEFAFDDERPRQGQSTTLNVDSNRAGFDIEISEADGALNGADLAGIFGDAVQQERNDSVVLEVPSDEASLDASFENVDVGNYTFEGEVTDASASDSADLEVRGPIEGDLAFTQFAYNTERGDTVTFGVDFEGLNDSVVRIEDTLGEYRANLSVKPEDGQALIEWNTFHAGTGNPDQAFTAVQGDVEVIDETPVTTDTDPRIFPDDYDLTAYRVLEGDSADFEEGFDEDAIDEESVSLIGLVEPESRVLGATSWVVPAGTLPTEHRADRASLLANASPTSEVATDDGIVLRFEVNGIFGYLFDDGTFDPAEQGLSLDLKSASGSSDAEWSLDDDGVTIHPFPEDDELLVAVDTATVNEDERTPDFVPGKAFEARFAIDESENDYLAGKGAENPEVAETATAIAERSYSFEGVAEDGSLLVPTDESTPVVVETSVAPETQLQIEPKSVDGVSPRTVAVDESGRATTTVDFSDRSIGDAFELSVTDLPADQSETTPAEFATDAEATEYAVSLVGVGGSDVGAGSSIDLDPVVRNRGLGTAGGQIEVVFDGTVLSTRELSLDPLTSDRIEVTTQAPPVEETKTGTVIVRTDSDYFPVELTIRSDRALPIDGPIDRVWRGQAVTFTDVEPNATVTLYQVADDGERTEVRTDVASENGRVAIPTASIEPGSYQLEVDSGPEAAEFTVQSQRFDRLEFADDAVGADQQSALVVESNRTEYTLEVSESSGKLSPQQLETAFAAESDVPVSQTDEGVELSIDDSNASVAFTPEPISNGNYTFDVTVRDAVVSETASLTVTESNVRIVDPRIAPYGSVGPDTEGSELDDLSTEAETVAVEDTVAFRFDGDYLDIAENPNLEDAFEVTSTGPNCRYCDPPEWDLDDEGVDLRLDDSEGDVYAVFNTSAINADGDSPSMLAGYSVDVEIVANGSSSVDVGDVDTVRSEFVLRQRVVEILTDDRGDVLVTGADRTDVRVQTTAAPGTDLRFIDEDGDGLATATVPESRVVTEPIDFRARGPASVEPLTVRESVPERIRAEDTVESVVVGGYFDGDRDSLDDADLDCCGTVTVGGFDAFEAVDLRSASGDEPSEQLQADEDGEISLDTGAIGPGAYELVSEDGTAYGPFEVVDRTITDFDPQAESVERGEPLDLRIASDQRNFAVQLFDAERAIPEEQLAAAIDGGVHSEATDRVYLGVEGYDRTISIDTSELPPGEFTLGGTVVGADEAATASFVVDAEGETGVQTAIAPGGSVDPGDSVGSIEANATDRSLVAIQDVALLEVPAELDSDGTVTLERRGDDGATWNLDDDGIALHRGDGRSIVSVDTGIVEQDDGSPSIDPGDEFDLSASDGSETFTGSFVVVERDVSIVGPIDDGVLQVPRNEETSVAIRTSVAPGSEVFVRARARAPEPFLQDTTVTVDERGLAIARFDFTERIDGQEFTISARENDQYRSDRIDAVFDDDAEQFDRIVPDRIATENPTTVSGFEPWTAVDLWRIEDGERVELVTRLETGGDGAVDLSPTLTERPERYVLVNQYGTETGPIGVYKQPALVPYANEAGRIDTDGLRAAVNDWRTGEIDTETLIDGIDAWQSGEPVV